MILSETVEGAVASLFFFDKAPQSKRRHVTEDKHYNYGHCGWYIVLGVCLFLGLKVMIKRYFSSKKTSQTEITQKRKHLGAQLRDILSRAFRIANSKTISPKYQVDPMRSIQLPRTIRKSLQDKLRVKTVSTSEIYNAHDNMDSPQLAINSTAEVSKMSEQSSRYQDAVSIRLSVKGQYSMKGSPIMSSQSLQENSVRRYSVAPLKSADGALEVAHSLVKQCQSKLSPHQSQKRPCQQLEVMQPQDTNSIVPQEEEGLDCNIRCVGDHEPDRKLPLYLTYPNRGKATQKMRSMFSRSKLATLRRSEQRPCDDLRFEDGTSGCTSVNRFPVAEINTKPTIPETLKATTSQAKKTSDIVGKGSRHGHVISQIESQRPDATSGVKKKSVIQVCKGKGYSVGSLAGVYTSLMCLNKTHEALTAPFMKNEDFHDGSNPARRKWQNIYKDTLEAVDLSYKTSPSKAPLLLEMFAPNAFKRSDTGKIDRHCQISQANFENRHALKRNRRNRVSKDEHVESMAMDIFEIMATQMQPTDFKHSRSSKIRVERKRRRICSGIQKNTLESKVKEDRRSLVGKKNDTCSSFAGTDISLCLRNSMVLQGTQGRPICYSTKEHDICPTATELNLAKHEHSKYHHIAGLREQEMPHRSHVHKKRRRKTSTTGLSLFDRRPESIRMVESLLSLTAARPTRSSMMPSLTDPSIFRKLVSKKDKSSVSSLTDAEAQEPLIIPTASTPEHVKIDFLKMPNERYNIKHKKIVKKSLRFAADTETHGIRIPMPSVAQPSPSAWSGSEKIEKPESENTVNGDEDDKSKTQKKRAKGSSDDAKLFDKLALQSKDDIKNALRLCQSAESRIGDKMSATGSHSPASMRIQKIRSRTRRYPSLMSFLDHIEKKNQTLKDGHIQVEDTTGPAIKYSVTAAETKRAAKDPIVTQEVDTAMIACPNGSKLGTGVRKVATEGVQTDYISGCTYPKLTTLSGLPQIQKQDANICLHFGTDSLQLYSESVHSVSFAKKDNTTARDVQVLLPHQSRTGSCAKQQHVMTNEPACNSESLRTLRRTKTAVEPCAAPTGTEKAGMNMFRRSSFRTIKKDVSKDTNTRENNSLHKVMSSVLNCRKPDMEREHPSKRQQCTKNGVQSSALQLKNNPKHGHTRSLLAFPDPSRGSRNLTETECLETGGRSNVSDARMLITECRTDQLTHPPVSNAAGNIDTFKEIISMEQHPLKSSVSGKAVQLSSPNRSRSIELSSPCWICAAAEVSDSPGQLETSLNETKTMYPCTNAFFSPLTKMPLVLKTEKIENIALDSLLLVDNPPRIRKRIRRLKTCSLGHVISKLSEAEIKPPRSDAFRDTDLSSTSKSLPSIDINVMGTTQNVLTGIKDKMPVIVNKLLIDSTKRQSHNPLGTSCEKPHSPNEEPASPMHNLLPASFSRNQQPLQSIRRGSLKDIFDRYVVHTSEYPQKHAARIIGKLARHPKTGESDLHCSLTDQDASTRSPTATSFRVKPDVSQRNISSYTSKHRANDNIDKSVRSPWRGTVAFRKRLQHLLQHNKHIQNKYRHINMTAKKTSPVNTSSCKLNSVPANKDKLDNIYKVSRIVRPGQVLSHISQVKHKAFIGAAEPGKANNVYPARTVVTPVSKLLDVRDEFVGISVGRSNKDLTSLSVKSSLQDKTTDEEKMNVQLKTSPTASNPLDTSALLPPQKVTHSSKNIITHSDHSEQKIQNQLKRHKETMEHKLNQTRGNIETKSLSNVTCTGTPTKSSAPCYVSNRRAFSSRPRVTWLHKQPGKAAGKQLETMPSIVEPGGKDMGTVDEPSKAATVVAVSPRTIIPRSQQTSNSERAVPETATGKVRNTVRVVGLDSRHSVDSNDIHAEVTRCDFFTPEQQILSADDTPLVGTIKKEMTRVSETEHNLQLLLDKIKHRSSLAPTASKDKEKENVDAPVGIIEKPDIKQMQLHTKLGKNQQSAERIPQTVPVIENVTEQTKSNFKTDKKTATGIKCASGESIPPGSCRMDKASTRSQKLGVVVKKMHEGQRKTDHHGATKAASKTEFTVNNRKHSTIAGKSNRKPESHDSSKTDEKAKLSARKIMHNKYKLMPRNKAKRATSSVDKMTTPGNQSCTTSASNFKHVAFNLHERVDKSNTESCGTIASEAASQESSEICSADVWCKEVNANDTEMLHSRGAKTAPLHNKVRQTMSVLNILNTDPAEQVGKNSPCQDIQIDQVSDISHTNEKLQSSTEAAGKPPCSSGYGTMDISTTSFSQLQNSSSVEPCKLAVEALTPGEVCFPGSCSDTQHGAYDHAVLHVCQQSEVFHESVERVPQASSLTTSFWKKEMHMDVIPEETDHENGVDSQTDMDSANSKLTEPEMKIYEIEEKCQEYMAGKEYPGGMKKSEIGEKCQEYIAGKEYLAGMRKSEIGEKCQEYIAGKEYPAGMKKSEIGEKCQEYMVGKEYPAGMKKSEIGEKCQVYMAGKEYPAEIVHTDKTAVGTANKAEVENISSEHDTLYLELCEAGQEKGDDPVVNMPGPTQDFDENDMETSGDVTESPMETLNKRNSATDARRTCELSVCEAEDIVWNLCDTVSEHSPPNHSCGPEQVDRVPLTSPHLYQAVAETISQIVGTDAYLTNNIVPENDSCGSRLHSTLGSELLNVDVEDTTHVAHEEEARCEETLEVNALLSCGNNVVVAKESSSFTTEPKSERLKLSNHHIYSSLFAKTLENYWQVSQSKSDSTATKHEVEVGDFISATEVPIKSTIYDIQETKSVSSVAEQSYGSSDNSLSQGVFQCTDDLDAASRKLQHEEINAHNIANTHQGSTGLKRVSQTSSILRNAGSSSLTALPNSDDESTFQKLSELSTANMLAAGDSTISQNKPSVGHDLPFGDKLTPDTNILAPNGSETTMNGCSRNAPFRVTALDRRSTAETQTKEFDIYSGDGVRAVTQTSELDYYTGDGVREQTSVGLQGEYIVEEKSTHSPTDNSGWNREDVPKAAVSHISSEVEVTKTEKYRSKDKSDTKIVLSSGGRKDNTDQSDTPAPAETVIREQNANVTKGIPASIVEVTKEQQVVARDTRRRAHSEGISQSVMDDLESLLNKELSQVNALGGLRQGCDVNRLFGTYYERNTRKEKRRRRSEKIIKQLPSQRELHYHFVRENDGSVKRTSSSTSQRTVFSPNDTATQHSSRAIRPLALGRVTKLEEFLQKAEETNRSETTSNMSRAVSKLSSFTSVTPSSQEEQLTPLKYQTRSSHKAAKCKQRASETEGNRSHEASEINTVGGVSRKPSQLRRIKNRKSNQSHVSQISENQHEESSCDFPRCTSNNDRSSFQDCVSDCTGNNDDALVTADGCGMLNPTESNIVEQTHARTYSHKIPSAGYSLHADMTAETRAKDNVRSWIATAETATKSYLIKNEASVNMRVPEAAGPSNNASKQMVIQQQQLHPMANIVSVQTTDECSALSTSSSSIVLSWIGSDLGDTEEIIQTPNFTDQEDKLYSDNVTELNNYHLHTPPANKARQFPIVTEHSQQSYPEYQSRERYSADVSTLWRSSVSDSVSHLTPMSGIILHESECRMPGYRLQYDSNVTSRVPHADENVAHSKLTRLKQNKDMLPMHTSLPCTEHALFETHKKEAKQTSQPRLPSNNYFQCPLKETLISSPASSKAPRELSTFWNNNPKECTLEQPSYFNALLRDPKWNPSFEIKEASNKAGHGTEEKSVVGGYVQSAWTYQRVRHMSPPSFCPQRVQECNSSMHPHSGNQQSMAQEKPNAHLVSGISAQRSNTNISFDMCSIHSNDSDPRSRRYPTRRTPPRNAFTILCSQDQPAIQQSKQDQEGNANMSVSQDFATRGIIKQDTFLRKVHFGSNFKPDQIGPEYVESTMRPDSQPRALVNTANNKSTHKLSLDKHLKTSTRPGAAPVKSRFSSEQRSQGTESTKTKTKMSLEQHLCSTFDTDRNSLSNAAQPSSENGTTKSTSSHASLNWYKPQSLPSSTSVSNGNASHGHQETSAQQEPTTGHERPRRPRTAHSELGITTSRRNTSGSTRRQDMHTLEHSLINSPNLVPSLSSSTHGKTSAQKSRKFSPSTQHNLLAQTLIPSLVPRVDKGSSESLSTPSSTSAHNSSQNQVPGLCWLRDPAASRVARQVLPCGNTRINGNKSTRRLTNTSNKARAGNKASIDCDDRTLANQSRGLSSNNRKPHTLSNNRSCYSLHINSEKKPEVNTAGACEKSSSYTQSVKRTRGSSVCSATNHTSEPRSGAEDLPDSTIGGTQHRTRPLSAHRSDGAAPDSHRPEPADAASPFQGARRVSKLVEMFEKKRAS